MEEWGGGVVAGTTLQEDFTGDGSVGDEMDRAGREMKAGQCHTSPQAWADTVGILKFELSVRQDLTSFM